ncbi:MAG: thiamine phosphate synthase [Pseudomonadota bacterium]
MDLNAHTIDARRLWSSAREAGRALPLQLPPVLVFTDPGRSADPAALAKALPAGWALVYRHFGAGNRYEIASDLAKLAHIRHFELIIGADAPLAKQVGAAGVHWPQSMAREARRWISQFRVSTMSAHAPSDVIGAPVEGIDARVLSTVFSSQSPSAGRPLGPVRFRAMAIRAQIPIYALGGVDSTSAGFISKFSGLAGVGQMVQLDRKAP